MVLVKNGIGKPYQNSHFYKVAMVICKPLPEGWHGTVPSALP